MSYHFQVKMHDSEINSRNYVLRIGVFYFIIFLMSFFSLSLPLIFLSQ